ncbi:endonuclease/exonuclease/phosphatase family protein [Sphingobacterium sp. JB170]|uniref:endonuclease/exonuclease/phosphatase family protein n=1 Tax=Sphingobacterium sp. JB170 TaxID=1434842 RepID=UPI00097EAC0F|nr:endonuclease/exonuclease/phosphatase family protein [Sphingobacterium sp. JB170]SJN50112.1 probable secreted protein [Sphingobacterium sp. JB170]
MPKRIFIIFSLLISTLTAALAQERIRVLSYNIHHGNPPGKPGEIDLEAVAKLILETNADIIGIQEVDVKLSRSNMIDQAKALAELTGMDYFFSKGIDMENGQYGTLILSKHKIVGRRRYDLPMPVASEQRSLAIVDVQLSSGKIISFANTHLDLKNENKLAQVDHILELADWYKRPLILVGDLNATPDSAPIKKLEGSFVRNTSSNGPTHPNVEPKNEIDYIMVAGHTKFTWKDYKRHSESNLSDHLAVNADLIVQFD